MKPEASRRLCNREVGELRAMIDEVGPWEVIVAVGAFTAAGVEDQEVKEALKSAVRVMAFIVEQWGISFNQRWETMTDEAMPS